MKPYSLYYENLKEVFNQSSNQPLFRDALFPEEKEETMDFSDEINFKFENPFGPPDSTFPELNEGEEESEPAELENLSESVPDTFDGVVESASESTPGEEESNIGPMELLLQAMQKLKEIEEKNEQELVQKNLVEPGILHEQDVSEELQGEDQVQLGDINEILQSAGNILIYLLC